jgi:hypothetical protein
MRGQAREGICLVATDRNGRPVATASSSRALCNKLGVSATDWIYAACIDKEMFGGSSITK